MEVKKGIVSNLSRTTNNFGRNGNNVTSQEYSWRFGTLQCYGKVGSNIGLSDGDELITVGKMKNGIFHVKALKNVTSGAVIKSSVTIPLIMGICLLALGLLTIIFIIGFVPLAFGIFTLYGVFVGYLANNLLEQNI